MIAYETRREFPEWKRIEHWPLYPPANTGSSGSILTVEPVGWIGLRSWRQNSAPGSGNHSPNTKVTGIGIFNHLISVDMSASRTPEF
jgi:hypothetical protein